MEKKKPENPQAFAVGYVTEGYEFRQEGMSLRDYFAAKAMEGHISSLYEVCANADKEKMQGMAASFYQMADAMLIEREKEVV